MRKSFARVWFCSGLGIVFVGQPLTALAETTPGSSPAGETAVSAEAGIGASTTESPELAASATADSASPSTSAPVTGAPATEGAAPGVPAYAGARANRSPDPTDADARFATVPYLQRFKPSGNLWEVGLYTGLLMPSGEHNLKVPTLPAENYNDVNLEIGARLAYYPLSFVGAEFEAMLAPSATKTTEKSALFYAARAHAIFQLPYWSVVPFALVGGGGFGAISESMGHDGDPLFHFGVGAKVPFNRIVSARLDIRDNLTQKRDASQGSATSHWEVLLGATFTFDRPVPPAPTDRDYDGLYDAEDKCPDAGALTVDGCPVGGVADRDGDGVEDATDSCPVEAGAAPSGCPDRDPDQDGVPVPCDLCPAEKGTTRDGCPVLDADGDGLKEPEDKCPTAPETKNGFDDADGCPDVVPEAVKKFSGVIPGISFVRDKAEIDPKSFATLDEAVKVLMNYPSVRLEVSGHTSSDGTAERNQELSVERAEAVKKYLGDKGVPEDRVVARGAGASEPIADNATRAGREKNRRIEFRILDNGASAP